MSLAKSLATSVLAAFLAAGGSAWAGGASGDRVPTYIEVTTDGALIIEASPAWDNPDGCYDPHRIFIPQTNAMLDRFYAATLTAYAGGACRVGLGRWLPNDGMGRAISGGQEPGDTPSLTEAGAQSTRQGDFCQLSYQLTGLDGPLRCRIDARIACYARAAPP
jgi:hypothetical protein